MPLFWAPHNGIEYMPRYEDLPLKSLEMQIPSLLSRKNWPMALAGCCGTCLKPGGQPVPETQCEEECRSQRAELYQLCQLIRQKREGKMLAKVIPFPTIVQQPLPPGAPRRFLGCRPGTKSALILEMVKAGRYTKAQIAEALITKFPETAHRAGAEVHSCIYRWTTTKYGYGWEIQVERRGGVVKFAAGSGPE